VPTNAEVALDMLSKQPDEAPQGSDKVNPAMMDITQPASQQGVVEHDSTSPTSLSPASRIKNEYQKRTRGRSSSGGSALMDSPQEDDTARDKSGKCF